jgi:hypothetical protein
MNKAAQKANKKAQVQEKDTPSPYQWEELQKQGYARVSTRLLLNLSSEFDEASLQQITERILENERSKIH